jgi:hypothetical protein
MEFSYRISEQEYIRAAKLYRKASFSSKVRKILFVIFVLFCLLLLFAVVMKTRQISDNDPLRQTFSVTAGQVVGQVVPLALILSLWFFIVLVWPRRRLRGIYRKSPALQAEVTVEVTPDIFSVQSSTGSASRTRWTDMKKWYEAEGLILLIYPTKIFQIVNVKGLSEAQHEEIRGILAAALPRK